MNLKARLENPAERLVMEMCIVPSATMAQAIAAAGVDILVVDMEHAATNPASLQAMIAATQGTDCSPMVRVIDHNPANVKLALDLGAEGIMFPLVRTAAEAAACVAATRYPPKGIRGWGAFVAHSRWGVSPMEYLPRFGDRIVCCLLIETAEALDDLDAILAVDGVDIAFVAPFDLSTSLGIPGQFGHPAFLDAVRRIEAAAEAAGVPLGGGPANTKAEIDGLLSRGYRIVAGFDVLHLKRMLGEIVGHVRAHGA